MLKAKKRRILRFRHFARLALVSLKSKMQKQVRALIHIIYIRYGKCYLLFASTLEKIYQIYPAMHRM